MIKKKAKTNVCEVIMEYLKSEIILILKENERLQKENERLKRLLEINKISFEENKSAKKSKLSKDDKISIFMDYFRGRNDCARADIRQNVRISLYTGVCNIQKYKCKDCPSIRYVPLASSAIEDHIRGKIVIGLYPMLEDDTCCLLAVDFDEGNWKQDAALYQETCKKHGLDSLIEISRSGNGSHVWIFFESGIKAEIARREEFH